MILLSELKKKAAILNVFVFEPIARSKRNNLIKNVINVFLTGSGREAIAQQWAAQAYSNNSFLFLSKEMNIKKFAQ